MPLLLHPRCGAARAAGPVATRIAATVRYKAKTDRDGRPILAPILGASAGGGRQDQREANRQQPAEFIA